MTDEQELDMIIGANHFAAGLRKAVAKLQIGSIDELTALTDEKIAEARLAPVTEKALRVMIDRLCRGEYPKGKKAEADKVVYKTPPIGYMIDYIKARGYRVFKEC